VITTAAMCLALNMFFEARNEPLEGQLLVAEVTLNRVTSKHYPNNVCDVVWQRKQFSWTHDGKHDDPTRMNYLDRVSWDHIQKAAIEVLKNSEKVLPGSKATHYHADYVKPYWVKDMKYIGKVGSHLFYKK
jgi:spore germination cell wall hydrolase CwlJ-like protein